MTILKRPVSTPSNLSLQAAASGNVSGGGASDSSDMEGGSSTGGGNSGGANKIGTKSLKQREEEYAQARLRILGSAEPETAGTPVVNSIDNSPSNLTSKSTPNVHLAQQKSLAKAKLSAGMSLTAMTNAAIPESGRASFTTTNNHSSPTNVKRNPKGPDGSRGFNSGDSVKGKSLPLQAEHTES